RGRIVAFEPYPATYRLLQKTLWINGFSEITECHQAAGSNQNANRTLFLGQTSGHHSLYELPPTGLPAQSPVDVAVLRLDDVLGRTAKVDLLKIDAEGAELEVLE